MIDINTEDQKKFYSDLEKHLSKQERKYSKMILASIKSENDIIKLQTLYDSGEHKELDLNIIKRMLEVNIDVYKNYINQLKTKYTENQFDNIIHILVETVRIKDISEEIIDIIKNDFVRDPQDCATVIQILGLCDNNILPYLYSFYKYFINNFPDKNYFEGPLYGLSYYIERRRRTTAST